MFVQGERYYLWGKYVFSESKLNQFGVERDTIERYLKSGKLLLLDSFCVECARLNLRSCDQCRYRLKGR
jgi:hypothetical protein